MRCVVGVSMGSWAVRAAVMDPMGRALLGSECIHEGDPDRRLTTALAVVESVSRRHHADPRSAVVVVPDDPASRVGRNILAVHDGGRVRLASELGAQLMFLRLRGLVGPALTIGVVDIGRSGTTLSVVESSTGLVHDARTLPSFRGDLFAEAVTDHLLSTSGAPEKMTAEALHRLSEGVEWSLEMLAVHRVVKIGGPFTSGSVNLSRSTIDRLVGGRVAELVDWVHDGVRAAPRRVDAVALVGGSANLPVVRQAFTAAFGDGMVFAPNPESVTAKGAALLAVQRARVVNRRTLGRDEPPVVRMPRHAEV